MLGSKIVYPELFLCQHRKRKINLTPLNFVENKMDSSKIDFNNACVALHNLAIQMKIISAML